MLMTLHGRQMADLLPTLIDDSAKSIRLSMYQLSAPTPCSHAKIRRIWQSLEAAPLRGVYCSAFLSGSSGDTATRAANAAAADRLSNHGWFVRVSDSNRMMHAKQLVIDERRVIIGSHNWTASGLLSNDEASLMIDDLAIAYQSAAWHDSLMEKMTG